MLMYRARNFETVRNFTAEGGDIARSLTASVLGDAALVELFTPTLQSLEREKIADLDSDVQHAIVEAIWAPSHEEREITVSLLTELVNTLLRTRGEFLEYNQMEIGWKLRALGFDRQRNGAGMFLRFSLENRILLHQRAKEWGLDARTIAGCDLCSPRPTVS
jgi:hypothetical protein